MPWQIIITFHTNGFATIDQFVTATNEVFGMVCQIQSTCTNILNTDIRTGSGSWDLAVYGTIMDGNPLSLTPGWSIGGPPQNTNEQNLLGNLLGLLGKPDGISGSHNKYQTDTSPTRGDPYQYDNDYSLQVSQFQTLFDLQPDPVTANYDMTVLA